MRLNGSRLARLGNTIFVVLPREAWVPIEGGCCCAYCSEDGSQQPAFWDTLALCAKPAEGRADCAWSVHAPEYHGADLKRERLNPRRPNKTRRKHKRE